MQAIAGVAFLVAYMYYLTVVEAANAFRRPNEVRKKRCRFEGNVYAPGETVGEYYDAGANTCHHSYCVSDGTVITEVIADCHSTSPETSTVPTTETSTLPPMGGCVVDGTRYPVDATISSGQSGDWCYGAICDSTGHVLYWDNFNCGSTTTSEAITPETSTLPQTTYSPTTTPTQTTLHYECFYNGEFYAPGSEIYYSENQETNSCYGLTCSEYGQIISWDNSPCFSTTTKSTSTTRRTTVQSMTTRALRVVRETKRRLDKELQKLLRRK